MNTRTTTITLLLAITGVVSTADASAPIQRLVIFGDSLCDTGNIDAMTKGIIPGVPYFDGRFSNGPVWLEELALRLAVDPPDNSIGGGMNFAFGGARTGTGFTQFIIPNMGRQVSIYFELGFSPQPGDLFVVLGGPNDFFMGETDAAIVVGNLSARITTLALAGATEFLTVNLPPLGQTPGNLGTPEEDLLDDLVDEFNANYAEALDGLEASLGITIHRFDLHGVFQAILDDPATFGLSVVDEPAYDEDSGAVVANPDEYLFWDDVHPTATVHARWGQLAHGRLTCPADVDGDGTVAFPDLLAVLGAWGLSGGNDADIDHDGIVAFADLLAVLAAWGPCT